jgi:hypothetical protein
MYKDWTIYEVGELANDLKLRRSPAEVAATLGREERDVTEKMAELGLSAPPIIPRAPPAPTRRKVRRRRADFEK